MTLSDYQRRLENVLKTNVPRFNKKAAEGEEVRGLSWQCIAKRETDNSFEYAFRVPIGFSIKELERNVDALYAACGCVVELDDRAGVVVVKVFPDDFPSSIPYSDDFLKLTKGREVLLGFDRSGKPVTHHFRVPHMLIAGMSGYGKTDLIRWLLWQLITRFTPEELQVDIIDMKGFSFLPFRNVPHVRVVRDLAGARDVLKGGATLMRERAKEIWDTGDRSLTDRYKWHLIVIDEAAQIAPDLMPKGDARDLAKECDEAAAQISQVGREVSVGLFYCTQRPDADVINPLVKANMDATFCFKTKTESNSLIVLDRPGAENLPHKKPGRGLYATDDLVPLLVPYIGKDDTWEDLLKPYKKGATDRIGRIKALEEGGLLNEGSEEEADFRHDERYSNRIDETNIELLFEEWQPGKTGVGSSEGIGKGEADRGQASGSGEVEGVASVIKWTFPS